MYFISCVFNILNYLPGANLADKRENSNFSQAIPLYPVTATLVYPDIDYRMNAEALPSPPCSLNIASTLFRLQKRRGFTIALYELFMI